MKFSKTLAAVAFSALSVSAFADITVQGGTFTDGASSQATALGTFEAFSNNVAGTFDIKAPQGGYQGVGVTGNTPGEVNTNERIDATFNQAYAIGQFTLGLLFDGPEYGDVNEKAQVTVNFADQTSGVYVLTATGLNTATWSGAGSFVNLSNAGLGLGGVWSVLNPFGNKLVTALSFTAIPGTCVVGTCTDQSDFTLVSVTAVPEAETYAMMLAGLGLMGAIARRRNKAKSA